MNIWLKIIIGLVVVIVVVVGLIWFFNRKVVAKGDEFVNFIKSGDMQGAYGLFSAEAKETTSYDAFVGIVDSFVPANTVESVLWTGRSVKTAAGSGTMGELNGVLKMKNGSTMNVTLNLIKTNGIWEIIYVNFKDPNSAKTTKEVQGIGESFLKQVFARDIATSYELLHSKFQEQMSKAEFEKAIASITEGQYAESHDWKARQVDNVDDGVYIVLEGRFTLTNKPEGEGFAKFILRQDSEAGNAWKITQFQVK